MIFAVLLLFCIPVMAAPTLTWDASAGAEGYRLYCGETPISDVQPIDVGADELYDLAGTVTAGIEYECWVTAYAAGFPDSGHSNHLVFTPPTAPIVEIVPGPPPHVRITW